MRLLVAPAAERQPSPPAAASVQQPCPCCHCRAASYLRPNPLLHCTLQLPEGCLSVEPNGTCTDCIIGYSLSGGTCTRCTAANCQQCEVGKLDMCVACSPPDDGSFAIGQWHLCKGERPVYTAIFPGL